MLYSKNRSNFGEIKIAQNDKKFVVLSQLFFAFFSLQNSTTHEEPIAKFIPLASFHNLFSFSFCSGEAVILTPRACPIILLATLADNGGFSGGDEMVSGSVESDGFLLHKNSLMDPVTNQTQNANMLSLSSSSLA